METTDDFTIAGTPGAGHGGRGESRAETGSGESHAERELSDDLPSLSAQPHAARPAAITGDLRATLVREISERLTVPVVADRSGRLVAELDVPGHWATAAWCPQTRRVEVRVAPDAGCDPASRPALLALMQAASASVCGVEVDAEETTFLVAVSLAPHEAALPAMHVEPLVEAFEAATVIARLAAAEADALAGDPALAGRYLEILDQHPPNTNASHNAISHNATSQNATSQNATSHNAKGEPE